MDELAADRDRVPRRHQVIAWRLVTVSMAACAGSIGVCILIVRHVLSPWLVVWSKLPIARYEFEWQRVANIEIGDPRMLSRLPSKV